MSDFMCWRFSVLF